MSACVSGCTIRGEHLAECDGTALGRDGELVDRVTRIRHVWRPVDHEGLTDLAMDVAAMEQHVRYGGGS